MDIRNLPNTVAEAALALAYELDETAVDHQLVHGSTITGAAVRAAATFLVLGAIPLIALDFATGGHRRRSDTPDLLKNFTLISTAAGPSSIFRE